MIRPLTLVLLGVSGTFFSVFAESPKEHYVSDKIYGEVVRYQSLDSDTRLLIALKNDSGEIEKTLALEKNKVRTLVKLLQHAQELKLQVSLNINEKNELMGFSIHDPKRPSEKKAPAPAKKSLFGELLSYYANARVTDVVFNSYDSNPLRPAGEAPDIHWKGWMWLTDDSGSTPEHADIELDENGLNILKTKRAQIPSENSGKSPVLSYEFIEDLAITFVDPKVPESAKTIRPDEKKNSGHSP